ncbi:hypothetical protein [Desulfobaculum bizertense]|uniref:hypothetical protein n=1 Tax=Desulfobaculum bizertense TaxID=376490 RepID=UPI0013564D68|nr:hypothetical protein [Desulfobaculum bizertense]
MWYTKSGPESTWSLRPSWLDACAGREFWAKKNSESSLSTEQKRTRRFMRYAGAPAVLGPVTCCQSGG